MIRQYNERLVSASDVPEPRLTVVPTAGQVVLLVGVEVQVSHLLAVGALNVVNLPVTQRILLNSNK